MKKFQVRTFYLEQEQINGIRFNIKSLKDAGILR